jgi:hypothetical protein
MERELLAELNEFVERAQRIVARHLPPDSGNSAEDAITELLGLLDGAELRDVQGRVRELLATRSVLFEDS